MAGKLLALHIPFSPEKKLGNTIGDDEIKINLTNPLTGDKIEYAHKKQ